MFLSTRPLLKTSVVAFAAVAVIGTPDAAFARKKTDTTQLEKGTTFTIKLDDTLHSGKNVDGDTFTGAVATGFFGDKTLKGFVLNGHVEGVKKAKMMGKKGELDIVFDELVSPDGKAYAIEAELTEAPKAEGKLFRNAGIIFAGAIAGHHIGKKADKKHGALLGAASATAVVLSMPGGDVIVKRGTKLKVRLDQDLTLD